MNKDKIITIDVGGKIYRTSLSTLLKIPYFANMVEGCENENIDGIFVDRSDMLFDHVLAYARDAKHPYPVEYAYELDFYGIEYDKSKLYDHHAVTDQKIAHLTTFIDESTKCTKLIKCVRCAKEVFVVGGGILCDICYGSNKCYNNRCNNITTDNYCHNHKNIYLCETRGCGNIKYKDLDICYKCYHRRLNLINKVIKKDAI